MTEVKETSIERIVGEKYCTIYTVEQKFINQIYRLQEQHSEVEIQAVNEDGSIVAHVPYNWFRFVSPPRKRDLTEEQIEALRERAKNMRNKS